MYRFYVSADQLAEKEVFISGGDVNHIKNVLRLEVGDWIVACDGNGTDYVSRIQSICSDEVVASIEKVQPTGTELPVRITLFQGMPKKDKLELIIQKAVELGACEIVPVMTKRTVVKLSEEKKINKRLERWQSIAYAAAKQCDRGIIPTVHKPVSYEEALAMADQLDYNVIPYELQTGMEEARKIVDQACKQRSLGIFIGPEGGFEPEEVERAMTRNIHPMTLGKRILRTETAGMALLSILMFQMQGAAFDLKSYAGAGDLKISVRITWRQQWKHI